jgi:hypothetical protein
MKQILFYSKFVFLTLFITSANAQEISKKNWTLIHERTADWCPFCGSWGWDMKNQILTKFANKDVIFMAVHHSGGLTNAVADTLSDNFGGVGQPLFFVDGVNINASSNNISTKLEETQLEVDFKASISVLAALGIEAELSETNKTLEAKAKVQFLEGVEDGDYYLGLYLLEDIMHIQSGRTGLQLHKNVLTKSLLSRTFGKSLRKGAIAKGTTFEVDAEISNVTTKRKDAKVLGVLWNKTTTGKYIFFNAFVTTPQTPSATNETALESTLLEINSTENQHLHISCVAKVPANTIGHIHISNIEGKVLDSKNIRFDDLSRMSASLSRPQQAGLYIISLLVNNQITSQKVYIH